MFPSKIHIVHIMRIHIVRTKKRVHTLLEKR